MLNPPMIMCYEITSHHLELLQQSLHHVVTPADTTMMEIETEIVNESSQQHQQSSNNHYFGSFSCEITYQVIISPYNHPLYNIMSYYGNRL